MPDAGRLCSPFSLSFYAVSLLFHLLTLENVDNFVLKTDFVRR